jgi:phosphomannomutase
MGEDILANVDASASDEAKTVIYDVKCSMNVETAILNAGGVPHMARTGHSFMKRVLAEKPECKMAAEMSGHIFLADRGWYGFDCSLYNAARLIEVWSRKASPSEGGPSFSNELDRLAPSLPTTGEVKVPCSEADKLPVVAAITEAFSDRESSTVDGVRVRFNFDGEYAGWYLARKSNTEAVLVMRVEAKTDAHLEVMMKEINDKVAPLINIEKLLNSID